MKLVSIRPSVQLLALSAVVLLCAILLPYIDVIVLTQYWLYMPYFGLGGLILFCSLDLIVSKKPPSLSISRQLPDILSLYQTTSIKLAISNNSDEAVVFDWIEKLPNDWSYTPYNTRTLLEANNTQEHHYEVTANKRGPASIEGTFFRVRSFLSLWQVCWFHEDKTEHKVYPNFTAISDLTGLNGSVNVKQMGLKKYNMRGSGMDFMQLRDYREGDTLRQIDWRASSRFNKLISKEFQEEKNQHIMIMLDAGRRMRVQDDELSYFEHALNALIMLSFTALKNGDNLSIQSFGSESRWLNQVRGAQNVSRVMHHFYDLYPEKIVSDYLGAAQELMQKHPKRSLVLLVTCLRDEDFEDLLISAKLLQEKNLVAVISIQEPIYEGIKSKQIEAFEEALDYASATILQRSIDTNIKRLKHQGVICIQTKASGLTASLINSYLSIKKAGLL
ncbi:MAG: hypothetical protein ACJAW1_000712 [Glaciecola sp.]|jgi:uncharacterized protein (DUF58 family)